jgi:peptidoglycan hydrolase CwlO-like protein
MDRGRTREKLRECGALDESTNSIDDLRDEIEDTYEAYESNFEDLSNKISDLADQQRELNKAILEKLALLQERIEAHDMRLAATRLAQQRALEELANKVFPNT